MFCDQAYTAGKYYIRATTGNSNQYTIDYAMDIYGFLKNPIDLHDNQENIIIRLSQRM